MLKKISILSLMLLYLCTATGFALNLHFCGNTVASVKINAPVKSCAPLRLAAKMKCCHNKHVDVKVKDAHKAQSTSLLSKIFAVELPKLPFEDYLFSAQKLQLEKLLDRGPPEKDKIPLIIKNCVFRI